MKALIVDDKPENLYLLNMILKGSGYQTTAAGNGSEALMLARRENFDVIISDILMPVMDGFTLCRELKKNERLSHIPFIFYTATYTDPRDEALALSLGADKFMLKPLDPDSIISAVDEVIKKAGKYNITPPDAPPDTEKIVLKEYNEALVRKLEDKMLQAEQAERDVRETNLALLREIEERKQAEQLLRENKMEISLIYDTVGDIIYNLKVEKDGSYIFTSVNRRFLKVTGLHINQVIGKRVEEVIPQPSLGIVMGKYAQAIHEQRPVQWEEVTVYPSGELIGEVCISPVFDNSMNCISLVGSVHDITKRKKTEVALSESESMFQTLARVSPVGIFRTNADGYTTYVNPKWSELSGLSVEEAKGYGWLKAVHPEDREKLNSNWQMKVENNNTSEAEYRFLKPDGSVVWVLGNAVPEIVDGKTCGYIGTITDITEQKNAREELILAKEQAEKSDRLKSEFLSQMSHEIRTPVNIIFSFENLVKEALGDNLTPELLEYFTPMESAGRRLIRTIDLILNVSELQVGAYEPILTKFDLLNDVLAKIKREYMKLILEKNLELIISSEIPEPVILSDRYSTYQIFSNLLDNAVKYTPAGSIIITIKACNNKHAICVSIEDTGIGISEEFMGRMFRPFAQEGSGYSRRFEGNGLGLSLVKKYCDLNGIDIKVESEKGKGTKFVLTFHMPD